MKKQLIQLGDRLVSLPGLRNLFLASTRSRVPIFLLHRASQPGFEIHGYNIDELLGFIDSLEALGFEIIPLGDVIKYAETGKRPKRPVVAFTADDGYHDQASVLGEAFAERELPLTIFLITDFIDGKSWTWDAKVAYAFAQSRQSSADVDVGNLKLHFDLSSPVRRTASRREYQLICKRLHVGRLDSTIASLCEDLEVLLPDRPPGQFAPMSWEQARSLEQRGVTFGPHTCTHRVMSGLPDEEIKQELQQSWRRISEELSMPLKVIAWPIGQNQDFGARELGIARSLEFQAAVAARHQISVLDGEPGGFLLDRLGFSIDDGGASSLASAVGLRRLNPIVPRPAEDRKTDNNVLAGVIAPYRPRLRKRTRAHALMSNAASSMGFRRRPAASTLRDIRRVIFVCQGNICRSPYAATLAADSGMPAISCGLEANNIASADEIGARMAFGRGVDLSEHVSANIDRLDIGPGDLLLGMEPAHLTPLQRIAHAKGAHASLLGLWAKPVRSWIEDPFGLAPEAFERVYRQIEDAVERLLEELPQFRSHSLGQ